MKEPTEKQKALIEPSDGPRRLCKGCGKPIMRATLENVAKVRACVAENCDRSFPHNAGVTQTLKRMREGTHCCYRCKHVSDPNHGHTIYCILEEEPQGPPASAELLREWLIERSEKRERRMREILGEVDRLKAEMVNDDKLSGMLLAPHTERVM